MKLIWNKNLQNKNFAGIRGGRFVFQNDSSTSPNENLEQFNWPSSATSNQEIDRAVGQYSTDISQQIGGWTTTASVENSPVYSDYISPRVDGMFSQNAQRFWRVDAQLIKRFFPETHLTGHINDSLEGLNVASQDAIGDYTNISNALHQQLEPTVNFVRHGGNMDNASLFDMDMVEHLATEANNYRQQKIKKSNSTGRKVLKNRSLLGKIRDNINPLNWPNAWQLRKSSQNNAQRSKITTKHFLSKAEESRESLNEDVERVANNVETHRKGWKNRYENDAGKNEFYQFIADVIADPNGFLNPPFGNPYNFADIFGTNSRVRVLDVIVLKGYGNMIIEEEKANQYSRDMTANLANLNTREVNTEATIQTLENGRIEFLRNRLPQQTTSAENPATIPSDEDLSNNLIREIIRIERRHTPGFDLNTEVFAGQANKMKPNEKIPYLLNYISDNANRDRFGLTPGTNPPANFAGLSAKDGGELRAWLEQYRDEDTQAGIGLTPAEWTTLQNNARDITADARAALTQCTTTGGGVNPIADALLAANHGNIPTVLAPVEAFVNNFELFKFEETINKINDEAHKGIFANFAEQMGIIKNKLAEMVGEIKNAYAAENARMAVPVTPPAVPPTRMNLAVGVPMTLTAPIVTLLNSFHDPTNPAPNGVMAQNHPGAGGGTDYNYDRLRVHLSNESKKSRETQFTTDLTYNSLYQWDYWQTALEGKVIPLLQGERADYIGNTSHSLTNMTAFNDLMIVDNRGEEIVLQGTVDEAGVDVEYTFIMKPEGEKENARIMLYQIESYDGSIGGDSQHGINTPKETVSTANAKAKFNLYNITADPNLNVHANPLLNAT